MLTATASIALLSTLTAFSPPSGRPPIGPLERHDPRVFEVSIDVNTFTYVTGQQRERIPGHRIRYDLENAEIVLPIILRSTFSQVEHDSIKAELWLDRTEIRDVNEHIRLEDAQPFNAYRSVIPIPRFQSDNFRWKIQYRTTVWSSRINDGMAGAIDWPSEWPEEVRDGLRAEAFIESDDPVFIEAIERITQGRIREVPPYHVAKEVVRQVLQNVQVEEGGEFRSAQGVLTGMNLRGAKQAASTGRATPHDLVAVCVAMLRAGGIPARPVVGIKRRGVLSDLQRGRGRIEFTSWAEFYLPGAGWVPFDPVEMRGKGLHREVTEAWPEFGTIRDLNWRVPMSFHFVPPATSRPPQYPAIWGWTPRGPEPGPVPDGRQEIMFNMSHQGRGEPDP